MKTPNLILLILITIFSNAAFSQNVSTPAITNPATILNQDLPIMVNPKLLDDVVKKENLIGKLLTNDCEKVKINEICELKLKEIIKVTNVQSYRLIKPKMPVTMDFSPNRVNVILDKNNKIILINIG